MKIVLSFMAIIASTLAIATPAQADRLDHLSGLAGDYIKFDSTTLERPFHIYVRLPLDYDETQSDYPVVYTLDGDIAFPIIGAYHYLLQFDEPTIPEAIVVGISYGTFDREDGNYRSTDYSTPPLPAEYRGGGDDGDPHGGAAAFQRFLKYELIPHIEKHYRAAPDRRILIGQSRGGHFGLYSAYSDPSLFWGRIVSNPAMNPNKDIFFAGEARPAPSSSNLYFASAERDFPELRADAMEWFEQWSDGERPPWRLNTVSIDGHGHAGGIVHVYGEAMKWFFSEEENSE